MRFRLLLPVVTATLAAALILVSHAQHRARDARCEARRAEAAWESAAGKTPSDVTWFGDQCDFIVPAPPATPADVALGVVGLPGILLSAPFAWLDATLGDDGPKFFYVAWLAGIALFWYRVGAWFDETLSDGPERTERPHFLLRLYFGCLRVLSPLVFVVVGVTSFSHHHANDILMLGVFLVWSGLGTFLLLRRFRSDERMTEPASKKE